MQSRVRIPQDGNVYYRFGLLAQSGRVRFPNQEELHNARKSESKSIIRDLEDIWAEIAPQTAQCLINAMMSPPIGEGVR